jgi:hypothetical protein
MRLLPSPKVLLQYERANDSDSRSSRLLPVGDWYTIGLSLGLGLGLSIAITGILGTNVLGIGAAAVVGAVLGGAIGLLIGDTAETIAGVVGGVLGALAAAAVVVGALRRGATRFGVGAYMGALGVLVCLVALIPIAGYALAVALPALAARLRGRQAARFAGLRTLAK